MSEPGTDVQRSDSPSRALARIVVVADMLEGELPAAMVEAVGKARAALDVRDASYTHTVLVVAGEGRYDEATGWIQRHAREDGADCAVVFHASDLHAAQPPLTVVLLDGAEDRDDWPIVAAEIAVMGAGVDVIRMRARHG